MLSVVIPSFNRPDGLVRAVRSLFRQTYRRYGFELVIVDNSPDATASDAIKLLRNECPDEIDFIAIHEPKAGVANARNTALQVASNTLIAFLDDDQSAPMEWLEALIESHHAFPAAVTFGPVETVLPDTNINHGAYFEDFFARSADLGTGYIETPFGIGNALVDFSRISGAAPWFDCRMNEIGGEDDLLFQRVSASNGRFAWACRAHVYEHPDRHRVTLQYTLKRAFAYGQGPITLARNAPSNASIMVSFWMLVGLIKACMHGAVCAGLYLLQHPKRAFHADRAVRGIAKVIWWMEFKFYGASAIKE